MILLSRCGMWPQEDALKLWPITRKLWGLWSNTPPNILLPVLQVIISRFGSVPKASFWEILQVITRLLTPWPYCIFYSDQRRQRAREWRWRRNSKILGLVIRLQFPGHPLPTPTRLHFRIKRHIRNDIRPKRNAFDYRVMRQNHKNVERGWECNRRDAPNKAIHDGIREKLREWLWWISNIIVMGLSHIQKYCFEGYQ